MSYMGGWWVMVVALSLFGLQRFERVGNILFACLMLALFFLMLAVITLQLRFMALTKLVLLSFGGHRTCDGINTIHGAGRDA